MGEPKINLEPLLTKELLINLLEIASKKICEEPDSNLLSELEKLQSFDVLVELIAKMGSQQLLRSSLVTMVAAGWESQKLFREFLDSRVGKN